MKFLNRSVSFAALATLISVFSMAPSQSAVAGNECILDTGITSGLADSADTNGGATATNSTDIACGPNSNATGANSTAIGQNADALASRATAIGRDANAWAVNSTAIGAETDINTTSDGSTTLGQDADVRADSPNSISIGNEATVQITSPGAIAIGGDTNLDQTGAQAGAAYSIAIGSDTSASGDGAIAIGGEGSDGDGFGAQATGIDSIAIGPDAVSGFDGAIVIGNGLVASEADQVILGSADVFTILGNGNVGLGTAAPGTPLHLLRSDDSAKILVEETNAVQGPRTLFEIKNKGNPEFRMSNSGNGNSWLFSAGLRFVVKNNAGDWVSRITADGDMEITGELTTTGVICGLGGCDLVFHPDTKIETIEEHASEMWAKSYLPSVGPTVENTPINLSKKTGGILNELEKAHIYIEQLHKRNLSLEQRVIELEQKNQRIEELVMQLVMDQTEPVAMK